MDERQKNVKVEDRFRAGKHLHAFYEGKPDPTKNHRPVPGQPQPEPPDPIDQMFAQAAAEFERGELVELEDLAKEAPDSK